MTDIRERHVPCDGPVAGMDVCADDNVPWPCDAIREADDKDKWQAAANTYRDRYHAEKQRADKAEAALAEALAEIDSMTDAMVKTYAERDAARADAKALAEALEDARQWLASRAVALEVQERIDAALAAHEESMK